MYGYTGLALVVGLWCPLVWFISDARGRYHMGSFEILRVHPFDIVVFMILVLATALAQFGFVVVAQDLAKYESRDRDDLER